jgi:prepilin-type N-terminal cleavage/methylation domain-containing protein
VSTTRRTRTPADQRRAFSLAEMVVSLAVVAVLVGSMTSVLMLSARAIDDRTNPAGKTVLAAEALDLLLADLSVATSFSERTNLVAAFEVPDRTGDGQPELVRYAWSGIPSDPLVRSFNGVTDGTFATDVQQFNLSYLLAAAPAPVEGATAKLMGHDDAAGGTMSERLQKSVEWCAQFFRPSLPADAASWKITSVQLVAANHAGTDGVVDVQIRSADAAGKPTAVVLATTTLYESSLPSTFGWVTVPIGPVADLAPGQGVCIVLRSVSGSGTIARWQFETSTGGLTADTHFITSTDSGATWSTPGDTKDLRFAVFGTVSVSSNCN